MRSSPTVELTRASATYDHPIVSRGMSHKVLNLHQRSLGKFSFGRRNLFLTQSTPNETSSKRIGANRIQVIAKRLSWPGHSATEQLSLITLDSRCAGIPVAPVQRFVECRRR